ncbi:MAG: TIGR03557 family F420-dependent LLM class oxidoreductase, partial [Microbacterium sp.]|nr:TIGR03557 family F420-dependent LLM class oxidoreductase [Microbacterium sp.]
ATIQLLSDGRFTLGLGSGENLNEHVVGEGWPSVDVRQNMLVEAVQLIRELHTGGLVTYEGEYFRVDSARIWDAPDGGVPIGIAVSGSESIELFAQLADHMIAVEPEQDLVTAWDAAHAGSSRKIGQIPISWDPDLDAAVQRAHEQFRWFAGGWSVNADLPTPAGFSAASRFVRPADVASSIACGPDLDRLAASVDPFLEAGFTDIALVQVGDELQERFLAEVAEPLLERIRARLGS